MTPTTRGSRSARRGPAPAADAAAGRPGGGSLPRARLTAGRRVPLFTVLVLFLAATGFAAWAGTDWYRSANDDRAAFGHTRDEALRDGTQAVQNLHTLDYRDLNAGLDTWTDSATGELREQLAAGREPFSEQISQAETVTTAEVLSGAVTRLDERAGTASVMVALRVTVRAPDEPPAVKESRMLGELQRTDDGWKLTALDQAPTGTSRH